MDVNFLAAVALTIITVLLLLLLLSQKGKYRIRMLLGFLGAICAVAAMVFFILARAASGGPDAGKEMTQLYGPCAAYLLAAIWSFALAAFSRKKLQAAKAAKQAAKAAEREAKQAKRETAKESQEDKAE